MKNSKEEKDEFDVQKQYDNVQSFTKKLQIYDSSFICKLFTNNSKKGNFLWSISIRSLLSEYANIQYSAVIKRTEFKKITETVPFDDQEQLFLMVRDALYGKKPEISFKCFFCDDPDGDLEKGLDLDKDNLVLKVFYDGEYTNMEFSVVLMRMDVNASPRKDGTLNDVHRLESPRVTGHHHHHGDTKVLVREETMKILQQYQKRNERYIKKKLSEIQNKEQENDYQARIDALEKENEELKERVKILESPSQGDVTLDYIQKLEEKIDPIKNPAELEKNVKMLMMEREDLLYDIHSLNAQVSKLTEVLISIKNTLAIKPNFQNDILQGKHSPVKTNHLNIQVPPIHDPAMKNLSEQHAVQSKDLSEQPDQSENPQANPQIKQKVNRKSMKQKKSPTDLLQETVTELQNAYQPEAITDGQQDTPEQQQAEKIPQSNYDTESYQRSLMQRTNILNQANLSPSRARPIVQNKVPLKQERILKRNSAE